MLNDRNGHSAGIGRNPSLLLVPGLGNSGPDHWQSLWEEEYRDAARVDLGQWDRPHRNSWVNKLNLAIRQTDAPVILVAHSLGCHAVAWWSALERPVAGGRVCGALLVAPPEVDDIRTDSPLAPFGPAPQAALPFPSMLVASRNDPYIRFGRAIRLAKFWGSHFIDAGPIGHINAQSDIGDWPFGRVLLNQLIEMAIPGAQPSHRTRQTAITPPAPNKPKYDIQSNIAFRGK